MEVDIDISIVIVNWNSVVYLRQCLLSIYQNITSIDFEVIIVDNASFDGSFEMVSNEFPQAVFMQSHVNLGFARANNLAAARTRGSKILFLNPDTEVLGTALLQMAAVFDLIPAAGAVGCKLLNTNGSLQTSCIQPFPTILNQALNAAVILRLVSKLGLWSIKPLFSNSNGIFPAEVISGACLMVSKDTFHAVGGFSSDYFMYTEDIDLCYKMKQAGFINYFVSGANVLHHGGGSSNNRKESSFANIQMQESIYKFMIKKRGCNYARVYRLTMAIVALSRIGLLVTISIPFIFVGRFPSIHSSFVKWISILRWALTMEKWAR